MEHLFYAALAAYAILVGGSFFSKTAALFALLGSSALVSAATTLIGIFWFTNLFVFLRIERSIIALMVLVVACLGFSFSSFIVRQRMQL